MQEKIKIKNIYKILTLSDKILIIILLLLTLFSFFYLRTRLNSSKVTIYYKGKSIGSFSLSSNKIITVDKGIVVEIKNGKVRMKKSTCKHQYCVKQDWSNSIPIVCVPNQVLIKFSNNRKKILITR